MANNTGATVLTVAVLIGAGLYVGHYVWKPQPAAVQALAPATNQTLNTDPSGNGTPIANLPQPVQDTLNFIPVGSSDDIAYLVESFMQYNSWLGSNNVPGTFTVTPQAHGASLVKWTLPATTAISGVTDNGQTSWAKGDKVTFQFTITQDGSHLTFGSGAAQAVLYYNNLSS